MLVELAGALVAEGALVSLLLRKNDLPFLLFLPDDDGRELGIADGKFEGPVVGIIDGEFDGVVDGLYEGMVDGSVEGQSLGRELGESLAVAADAKNAKKNLNLLERNFIVFSSALLSAFKIQSSS